MDDAIRFIEGGEETLDFLSHSAWSMLLVEITLVSLRLTCFFRLEDCLEFSVYNEVCSCPVAEIAEGGLTPLPWLGHHEDLSTTILPTTIMLMQIENVLALEVTQALLCCIVVGHEC